MMAAGRAVELVAPRAGGSRAWWRDPRRGMLCVLVAGVALLLVAALALAHALHGNPAWRISTDMGLYLQAAHAVAHGRDPYAFSVGGGHRYVYAPLFAEVLVPFTVLGDTVARALWLLLNVGCLAATAWLLGRGFGVRVPQRWLLLGFALLCLFYPVRNDLYHGEANPLLLFLFALAMWLDRRGRQSWVGILLGTAAAIKPPLIVLAAYFLWRRRSWTAAWLVGSAAVLVALSFAPLRPWPHAIHQWLRAMSSVATASHADNHSLYALLLYAATGGNAFLWPWQYQKSILLPGVLTLVAALMLVLALGLGSRPALVLRERVMPAWVLVEAGCVFAAALAFGPLTETDHLLLLLPAAAGTAIVAFRLEDAAVRRFWLAAVAAWLLLALFIAGPVGSTLLDAPATLHIHGARLMALWLSMPGWLLLCILLLTAQAIRALDRAEQRARARERAPREWVWLGADWVWAGEALPAVAAADATSPERPLVRDCAATR
jgi:hypothetical protein